MKTVLITGGSGFFGWNAMRFFRERGYTVLACAPEPERYKPYFSEVPFCRADILDPRAVVDVVMQARPDYIIHAAAHSTPASCERNPVRAHEINVIGTGNVFGAAVALHVPFVFLSTDLVFDGERGHYTEADAPAPGTVYGDTKLKAERMLQTQPMFRDWIVLRCSLMFGNGAPWTNAFPQFAERALRNGDTVQLFLDQYRTPVFVDDVARAIDMAVERKRFSEIFHCGGPERLNRVEFVRRYCKAMDIPQDGIREIMMDDMPEYSTRVRDVSLNSTKLRQAVHWRPTPIEEAFEEMKHTHSAFPDGQSNTN